MEGIYEILDAIYSSSKEEILAAIIHIERSAYRKQVSSMLIRGDGSHIGLLSSGCLDTDLMYRLQERRDKRASETIIYDMREEDDLSWGQGADGNCQYCG